MERIEPIRRGTRDERAVVPISPVGRREQRRDGEPRERRRPQARPVVTRDDDGTPHVDVRA